ncbi:MAG: ribosome recycling factor [Chloroflexi bacterium]|nr:ribosome recycling factor [Chloroflexota bacterium]MBU1750290.1 ribosome recycling factor [Chloroflexota bacterium]MBU1877871.1 ribosome recycling factor [Chloroflexota bacterium]
MVDLVLEEAEGKMSNAEEALRSELATIRTGRASPAILERLHVEYYGVSTPLNQAASISAPEPRLLIVNPWERQMLTVIEKAILKSDLGLNPINDGQVLRLAIPALTEERRRELVRSVGKRVEEGRVAVRNCRRDAQNDLRKLEKDKEISQDDLYRGQEQLQDLTDRYIKQVDEIGARKETEILEI